MKREARLSLEQGLEELGWTYVMDQGSLKLVYGVDLLNARPQDRRMRDSMMPYLALSCEGQNTPFLTSGGMTVQCNIGKYCIIMYRQYYRLERIGNTY